MVITGAVTALLGFGLGGCAGSAATSESGQAGGVRSLTSQESEALAISRFTNYDDGVRQVDATIPDGPDTWRVHGWFDYREGRGYATLWADGAATAAALLLWSDQYLLSHDGSGVSAGELPPLPVPGSPSLLADEDPAWVPTTYAADEFTPHVALRIIASLGADRPDNPLLLQQSDALRLGTEKLDGVELDVFAGPRPADSATDMAASPNTESATIRYWLDPQGHMHRVEMRLGNAWGSVDLADAATDPEIPDPTH
ncbi:hypothetical protein [Phytoactinopolyspora endophytica]|uniref:hypothetical protein n=1 Tax=Phytoactinopolyspora endophytica TaxID=1642495 RepID=UPI0013EA6BB4|nr:hypothetical protein [Phytoactinopolyspora endophytica]